MLETSVAFIKCYGYITRPLASLLKKDVKYMIGAEEINMILTKEPVLVMHFYPFLSINCILFIIRV